MDSFMQGTAVACSQAAAALSMAFVCNEIDVSQLEFYFFCKFHTLFRKSCLKVKILKRQEKSEVFR